MILAVSLLTLQIFGTYLADTLIEIEFAGQLDQELRDRFAVIASEIERNGYLASNYPRYNGEVIYFQADPVSAAAAPDGIFDLRGAVDGDLDDQESVLDLTPGADGWYYFIGEAAGSVLVIGTNLPYSSLFTGILPRTFMTVGITVSLTVIFIGMVFSVRNQRRLNLISETLTRASQGDLAARVGETKGKDDLDRLAKDIDATLERLELLFNQTRNLGVNIAHDLKTPLARLRLRLENAQLASDPEVAANNVDSAMEQADHVIAVFQAFMRIARLETGSVRKRFEPVQIANLCEEVAATFGPVVEDSGFEFELKSSGNRVVHGDTVLLTQMLTNLIENAMRHTPKGTMITLVVDETELGVADSGPGIPADAYEEVIKPSVRLDASRASDGAGLGLALVKTIADVHDAELILSENEHSESPGLFVRARFS